VAGVEVRAASTFDFHRATCHGEVAWEAAASTVIKLYQSFEAICLYSDTVRCLGCCCCLGECSETPAAQAVNKDVLAKLAVQACLYVQSNPLPAVLPLFYFPVCSEFPRFTPSVTSQRSVIDLVSIRCSNHQSTLQLTLRIALFSTLTRFGAATSHVSCNSTCNKDSASCSYPSIRTHECQYSLQRAFELVSSLSKRGARCFA
jgi:hypothetical protein